MMKTWYQKTLGSEYQSIQCNFWMVWGIWQYKKAQTQWTPFKETTKYFAPSEKKEFMINYRVENLEALAEDLKKEGVTILDTIETYDYGKFLHILDAEGNKIELWEPVD